MTNLRVSNVASSMVYYPKHCYMYLHCFPGTERRVAILTASVKLNHTIVIMIIVLSPFLIAHR